MAVRIAILMCMIYVQAAHAGDIAPSTHISEVFLANVAGSPVPDAVELANLDLLSEATVDLVVLDAAADHPGDVLQVVTVPTSTPLMLISDQSWPSLLWQQQFSVNVVMLEQLGLPAGTGWQFNFSRTLVLLDRSTQLIVHGGTLTEQQDRLGAAQVLDVLTFKRSQDTVSFTGEPILDTAAGYAISRPYDAALSPKTAMIGTADAAGHLAGVQPEYALTPGWQNPVWPTVHHPEPGTGGMLLVAALFWARRRPIISRYGR